MTKDPLDPFFDAPPVVPSAALMSAVLADAAREQGRGVPVKRPSIWAQLLPQFGGIGGLAGLAACACVGLWLGYADIAVFDAGDETLLTDIGLSLDDVFLEGEA